LQPLVGTLSGPLDPPGNWLGDAFSIFACPPASLFLGPSRRSNPRCGHGVDGCGASSGISCSRSWDSASPEAGDRQRLCRPFALVHCLPILSPTPFFFLHPCAISTSSSPAPGRSASYPHPHFLLLPFPQTGCSLRPPSLSNHPYPTPPSILRICPTYLPLAPFPCARHLHPFTPSQHASSPSLLSSTRSSFPPLVCIRELLLFNPPLFCPFFPSPLPPF